jgi:hypothetical protein
MLVVPLAFVVIMVPDVVYVPVDTVCTVPLRSQLQFDPDVLHETLDVPASSCRR